MLLCICSLNEAWQSRLTLLYSCREKLGWLVNSAAAVVFTIVLIVVLTRAHYGGWQSYGYGPY